MAYKVVEREDSKGFKYHVVDDRDNSTFGKLKYEEPAKHMVEVLNDGNNQREDQSN